MFNTQCLCFPGWGFAVPLLFPKQFGLFPKRSDLQWALREAKPRAAGEAGGTLYLMEHPLQSLQPFKGLLLQEVRRGQVSGGALGCALPRLQRVAAPKRLLQVT